MPRIKGQSDGIRKRGAQHPEHTISLAGKKETSDAEEVFLRREEPKEEPEIVKRDIPLISLVKKEEFIYMPTISDHLQNTQNIDLE